MKELKEQIKGNLEEINAMKKNIKQTRVQELEVFLLIMCFFIDNLLKIRLKRKFSAKKISV